MITDESTALQLLINILNSRTEKYLRPNSGILFSGGVDSSLITALTMKHIPDIKLFTIGIEGSNDILWAKKAAGLIGLDKNLCCRIITLNDIDSIIPKIIGIVKTTDPMTVSLGIPLYILCTEAKAQNIDVLLTGQGADELFGGYHRYNEIAKDGIDALHTAIVADVSAMPGRDIKRDKAVSEAAGVELITPFFDTEVIRIGLSISAGLKVKEINTEIVSKYILRKAAVQILPEDIAWRDKKAFQYGSGVWASIEKLARLNGFRKQDKGYIRQYLNSMARENRIRLDETS